jgi:Flp pilus assembly protein TadG
MNGSQGERGSVSIWALLVTAGAFTVLLGLIVDGGHVIDARLEASRVAAQAARLGADQLSAGSVRSGHDAVNAEAAATQARRYLAGAGEHGTVHVDADRVTVTVVGSSPAHILSAFGIDAFPVHESATAQGITDAELP